MNKRLVRTGFLLATSSLALLGCTASRGTFAEGSCNAAERIGVYNNAAYAIFVDAAGNPIGKQAEDLTGTVDNQMCPTPEPDRPGACKTGYCPKTIGGATYCLRC